MDVLVISEVRSFECIVCGILQPHAHRHTDRQTDGITADFFSVAHFTVAVFTAIQTDTKVKT